MVHHTFNPLVYHTTIGQHEPVLEIGDGDSVTTSTVDASGFDARNEQVTEKGNPQTGPFFIRDAEPGDTLVVTFEHMEPNRKKGYATCFLDPHVIEPQLHLKPIEWSNRIEWEIDLRERIVRPLDVGPPLSQLSIPLKPILGCFGVAPPRGQFISSSVASTHGGNMDYNHFCAGITVYLPIFCPGALFSLGNGHAAQGDGEVTGSGIEVSEEITFRVRLNKGQEIHWPRAEDDRDIMTVGSTRPLDDCVRHATTEMLDWLVSGFGLDLISAHTVIGHGVEYDIANMVSPNYTVVCKLAKKTLQSVGVRFE